jgi:hypothetical protein
MRRLNRSDGRIGQERLGSARNISQAPKAEANNPRARGSADSADPCVGVTVAASNPVERDINVGLRRALNF